MMPLAPAHKSGLFVCGVGSAVKVDGCKADAETRPGWRVAFVGVADADLGMVLDSDFAHDGQTQT